MTLFYQNKTEEFQEVEEKLKSLSLAFQVRGESESSDLILEDGNKKIVGHQAVLDYLENLEGELNKWYYCDC